MSKEIMNKIVDEAVDTIIDNIEEVDKLYQVIRALVDYMFDYDDYEETNDKFFKDKEEMFVKVIKELYNRINNNK